MPKHYPSPRKLMGPLYAQEGTAVPSNKPNVETGIPAGGHALPAIRRYFGDPNAWQAVPTQPTQVVPGTVPTVPTAPVVPGIPTTPVIPPVPTTTTTTTTSPPGTTTTPVPPVITTGPEDEIDYNPCLLYTSDAADE